MVQKWETGKRFPLPVTQQRLADLFGVGMPSEMDRQRLAELFRVDVGEIAFGQVEEQP